MDGQIQEEPRTLGHLAEKPRTTYLSAGGEYAGCGEILSRAAFIQRYVLNRAAAHVGGLDAEACVKQAKLAWKFMNDRDRGN